MFTFAKILKCFLTKGKISTHYFFELTFLVFSNPFFMKLRRDFSLYYLYLTLNIAKIDQDTK